MNKRQIEVQQVTAENEQRIIRQLKQVYNQASKDCAAKIQELSMRTDMENLQTIIYQKQYQEAMKKQIDAVLNELNSKSFTSIADYLGECYETGFIGTLYDLQGQGIPLCFPINQEEVVQALQVDSKISQGLYKRMGEDTEHLKKSIKAELSRGISNGSSWNAVAGKIASSMNSPFTKAYNRAIGIARTEGHRVQQESTLHCQQRAKAKGADVVKQWDSTLDGVTRPHHIELDGQIREIDEPFEVAGMKAMYPGGFGNPAEDCNCRCCLLQRARWALGREELDTLKERAAFFRLNKTKNFRDFKEKFFNATDSFTGKFKLSFPNDVYKVKGFTAEVKDEVDKALKKLETEYDVKLNSIVVEPAGKGDIFVTGYHDGVVDMVVNENADFDAIKRRMQYRYKNGYMAGKSLEDYLTHEMAHCMLYQDCTSDVEYNAKYNQIESLYSALKGISGYADIKQSGNEALAEAFVRVRNKEEVPQVVKVLVESYFGKWKK